MIGILLIILYGLQQDSLFLYNACRLQIENRLSYIQLLKKRGTSTLCYVLKVLVNTVLQMCLIMIQCVVKISNEFSFSWKVGRRL